MQDVLILDSENPSREEVSKIVENESYSPTECRTLEEAKELIYSKRCGMVVADLNFQGHNSAVELLNWLRAEDMLNLVPLVVTTHKGEEWRKDVDDIMSQGAFQYITKPLQSQAVRHAVRRGMKSPKPLEFDLRMLPAKEYNLKYELASDIDVLEGIMWAMNNYLVEFEYPQKVRKISVPIVIDELVTNAIKHGNKYDLMKTVKIESTISRTRFTMSVEDEGVGFNPNRILDNFEDKDHHNDTSGRGLAITQFYMDELKYNERGNRVTVTLFNK